MRWLVLSSLCNTGFGFPRGCEQLYFFFWKQNTYFMTVEIFNMNWMLQQLPSWV